MYNKKHWNKNLAFKKGDLVSSILAREDVEGEDVDDVGLGGDVKLQVVLETGGRLTGVGVPG